MVQPCTSGGNPNDASFCVSSYEEQSKRGTTNSEDELNQVRSFLRIIGIDFFISAIINASFIVIIVILN